VLSFRDLPKTLIQIFERLQFIQAHVRIMPINYTTLWWAGFTDNLVEISHFF